MPVIEPKPRRVHQNRPIVRVVCLGKTTNAGVSVTTHGIYTGRALFTWHKSKTPAHATNANKKHASMKSAGSKRAARRFRNSRSSHGPENRYLRDVLSDACYHSTNVHTHTHINAADEPVIFREPKNLSAVGEVRRETIPARTSLAPVLRSPHELRLRRLWIVPRVSLCSSPTKPIATTFRVNKMLRRRTYTSPRAARRENVPSIYSNITFKSTSAEQNDPAARQRYFLRYKIRRNY